MEPDELSGWVWPGTPQYGNPVVWQVQQCRRLVNELHRKISGPDDYAEPVTSWAGRHGVSKNFELMRRAGKGI